MSESHDDAAAYVLGALEPQELPTFLAHLEQCSICQEEVESLAGVVQALPMAAAQYKVPRSLRRRVMRGVRQSSPELSRARGVQLIGLRISRSFDRLRLAGAGVLAGVGATAVTLVGAAAVAVIELSSGAGTAVIQANVTGIQGTAQLKLNNGHAELVVRHMTSPGKGHIYEVWLKSGDSAPVPASVLFSVSSGGNADVTLPDRIKGTESVLVTKEPLGGTKSPTSAPVVSATVD